MHLPALALLLAVASITPSHAAGLARTEDPSRASAPASAQPQRTASKNAFGQAMAELARGLRNVRPADAATTGADPAPARKPAAVAVADPASGG